jgi:hypothetical protein
MIPNQIIAHGKVDESGKLQLYDRIGLLQHIQALKNTEVKLVITPKLQKRTKQQNHYYWGVVIPFVQKKLNELGWDYDPIDVHTFCKSQFCAKEVVHPITNEIVKLPQSTAKLSKEAFQQYLQRINQFLAENFGETLPEKNQTLQIPTSTYIQDNF